MGGDLDLRLLPEMTGDQSNLYTSEQPDLTLRLCLGEPSLTRSSSVMETWKWDMQKQQGSFLSLARSCSLPAKTDQMGRVKLKELQLLRNMAEQKSGRAAAAAELVAWAANSAAKSPALCRAIDKIKSSQGSLCNEGQGSVGSTKISSNSQSSLESKERGRVVTSQTITSRKPERPLMNVAKRAKVSMGLVEEEGRMGMIPTMPSVTTTGDGPNGRKVEGVLYKYKKGQICIVCVCHGSFLTPTEFVQHAGGREVANPMKHIHVSCTSL